MKNIFKYIRFHYNMLRYKNFRALVNLDERYVIRSTWDDPLNQK